MNLSNYFFITDSVVMISTTCSLLALYFRINLFSVHSFIHSFIHVYSHKLNAKCKENHEKHAGQKGHTRLL